MADKKITQLTAHTSVIDADVLPIVDNTAVETKKVTWQTIKSTLKTYFDTIYPSTGAAVRTLLGITTLSGSNTGDQTTTAGLANSTNKNLVTDAQLVVISNTSGVNTGDQDLSGLVPKTTTVNGHALSGNVTVTASDVGLGNVTNDAQVKKSASSTSGAIPTWNGTTGDSLNTGGLTAPSGTIVGTTDTQTLTNKRINPRLVTASSYTTDTGTSLDVSTCDQFEVTAQAGALKFNNPGGTPLGGQKLIIRVKDNGTPRALTYDTQFRASSDLALPTTTVTSKTLYMGFVYNATDTKWDLLAVLNNF